MRRLCGLCMVFERVLEHNRFKHRRLENIGRNTHGCHTVVLCSWSDIQPPDAGVIVVYDVTDEDSFIAVPRWLQEIEQYCPEDVNRILVGNKCEDTYIQCRHALAGCIRLCEQNRATTDDSILSRFLALRPDEIQQQIIQRAFPCCDHKKKVVDSARAKAIHHPCV